MKPSFYQLNYPAIWPGASGGDTKRPNQNHPARRRHATDTRRDDVLATITFGNRSAGHLARIRLTVSTVPLALPVMAAACRIE